MFTIATVIASLSTIVHTIVPEMVIIYIATCLTIPAIMTAYIVYKCPPTVRCSFT